MTDPTATEAPEKRKATLCLFCQDPVKTAYSPGYGTYWIHTDGHRQCRPTYASPNFFT